MKKLENKTVLITGGLSGIGKASAVIAAAEGANVVVVDIKSVAYDSAMLEIKAENDKSIFLECDVTKADQIAAVITTVIEKFGSLDVALNNAGVGGGGEKIVETKEEEWNSIIHINLTSVFNCMRYQLKQMSSQKSGTIINMSSIHGKVGFANSAAYVASKHGIIGLTQTAALEYASDNIRVNAICPGFIETPLLTKGGITDNEKVKRQITELHPLKRFGKPEEVAKSFLFLASDDSSFITGTALEIDGGYLAQ
ncbi:MAG: SDR family oxidoreductase [Cyclobacteriaceae bacterium]|nr:SDR family oxidoreductase [Cyclobacteriaceae bacterium]